MRGLLLFVLSFLFFFTYSGHAFSDLSEAKEGLNKSHSDLIEATQFNLEIKSLEKTREQLLSNKSDLEVSIANASNIIEEKRALVHEGDLRTKEISEDLVILDSFYKNKLLKFILPLGYSFILGLWITTIIFSIIWRD